MNRNEEIIEMYFIQKMKQKDIAEKMNISKYIVSRVVSKDIRYNEEKERRKEISIKKHNSQKAEYVNRKRKNTQNEYMILRNQHIQASLELSGGSKAISNRAFRDWNTSIYKYDYKTKSYRLKSNVNATYDVPKKIKW